MKRCEFCGAMLDVGEKCDCQKLSESEVVTEAQEELKLEVVPFEPVQKIEFNKSELETKLKAYLSKYDNLVITKDMTADMKKERSELNKLIKALNAEKIRQKKIFTEPVTEFEKEVKELISLIEKATSNIDTQLKSYEEQEKQEKISKLREFFDENKGELPEDVTFESIYRKEWENKSESLKSCQNTLKDRLYMITRELEQVRKQCGEFVLECEVEYLKKYNFIDALNLCNILKRKRGALEKLKADVTPTAEIETKQANEENKAPNQTEVLEMIKPGKTQSSKLFKVVFELNESLEVLNGLKAYMDSKKINYKVIK